MIFSKIHFLIIFFLLQFVNLNAERTSPTSIKPSEVTVSCWKHNEPYSYISEEGKPSGIFIDLWLKWAEKSNIKVNFKFYETLHKSIIAVIKNKADIHSGIRITDSRKKYLTFAKRRFFPGRLAIFYAGYETPVTFKNLSNKNLGVINNSFVHYFIKKNYPDIRLVTYNNRKQMIDELLAGNTRAFISNEPSVLKLIHTNHLSSNIKKTPGFSIEKDFYVAISKKNEYLLPHIYAGITQLNYKDFLEIEAKYIYNPNSKYYYLNKNFIELTEKEISWISNNKNLIVGYLSNNAPIEFNNEEGDLLGITKDILNEINKKLNFNFSFKEIDNENNIPKLINENKYHIITSSQRKFNNDTSKLVSTLPYAGLDIVLAVRKNSHESRYLNFNNKIIACNNPIVYNFISTLYQNNKIIRVKTAQEGIKILINKHADLFIGELPSIKYSISELKTDQIEIVYETLISNDLSFLVSENNQILKTLLNKAILAIDNHRTQEIVNKWSNITIKEKTNWTLLFSIGIPIALAAIIGYILLLITSREIRKRNEAQKELLNTQKKLVSTNYKINKFWRNISNKMTSAFLHIGFELSEENIITNTQVININSKFENLLNTKRKEIINKSSDEILDKLNIQFKSDLLEAITNRKEFRFDSFNQYLEKHLDFLIIPIDKNQIVLLITDITDKKQNEINLLEAQKMESIAQLAGSIAHDFNNQLMGILGYSNLLKDQVQDPELKNYASIIINGAKKSAGLTNQLLAFSRKGKYRNVTVNVNRIINNIIKIFKDKNPKINIDFKPKATKYNISGEPQLVHNALLNIIMNSFEAISDKGFIKINTYNTFHDIIENNTPDNNENEYLVIEIIDNGPGIDEINKSKIFEPFYSTKNTGVGQGLGLPAAKGAILSHKGKINVENLPEVGCKFNILLPILQKNIRTKTQSKQINKSQKTNSKANILIVDDEEIVRSIVKDMLIESSNNVISFSNGVDAINYYRDNYNKIDLVLLDIIMPEISGKEVFYNLKKINKNINVIIFSGYTMDNSIQELLDKGVKDFIHKPVNKAILLNKISNILGNPKTQKVIPKSIGKNTPENLKAIFTDTDIDTALKNLGQDIDLYIKLISRFYEKYPDLIENIKKSLKNDSEAGYIIAHSIKSLAATLGRYKLQNAAIQIERAIQNNEDLTFPLEIFENEFLSFMDEIRIFLKKDKN